MALGTLTTLEDTSGQYLTDTGQVIAEPLEGRERLATSILDNPPEWAVPTTTTTTAPTTTTTSTTIAPSSSTSPSTTPPSSTPTTAAPTYPSGAKIFTGVIGTSTPNMCLEVIGSQLKQVTCSSSAAPLNINQRPDGFVTVSMANGSCFGTESNNTASLVKNQTCTEADNQLWTVVPSWNGTVQFKNKITGFCMDVSNNSTSSGADIIQWGSGDSPNGQCKDTSSNNNHNFPLTASNPPSTTTTTTAAPTTTTAPPAILEANAGQAVLSGNMRLNNGRVGVANGTGNNMNGPNGTTSKATFSFTVTQAGTYRIQGNTTSPTGNDDSFYVTVSGSSTSYTWSTGNGDNFVSDGNTVNGPAIEIPLQPGQHTVTIHLREDGAALSSPKLVKV